MILPDSTVVSSNWGPISGPPLTYAVFQLLRDSYEVSHVFLKFHLDSSRRFLSVFESG